MFIRCSFDEKENKFKYYRGKDCIIKACKKLKQCTMEIINREKKRNRTKNKKYVIYAKKSFIWIKMTKII